MNSQYVHGRYYFSTLAEAIQWIEGASDMIAENNGWDSTVLISIDGSDAFYDGLNELLAEIRCETLISRLSRRRGIEIEMDDRISIMVVA